MIVLRNSDEIDAIRRAGRIVALVLEKIKFATKPGVETMTLDRIARDEILKNKGLPAFKGYKGYPANICASINEVVVHGIPSDRRLESGDIISIDVGVKFRDYYADGAVTIAVGEITDRARELLKVTEDALYAGIDKARKANRLSDISSAVQGYVEANDFSVVRMFVGHGIGTKIHEEPEIPNFGSPGKGPALEPGMVLAIEPMVNAGTHEVEILEDGWTAVTKDRKLSAHFEHTIAVTDDGALILTKL